MLLLFPKIGQIMQENGFNLIPYNYYFSNKFFEKMKIDGVIFSEETTFI